MLVSPLKNLSHITNNKLEVNIDLTDGDLHVVPFNDLDFQQVTQVYDWFKNEDDVEIASQFFGKKVALPGKRSNGSSKFGTIGGNSGGIGIKGIGHLAANLNGSIKLANQGLGGGLNLGPVLGQQDGRILDLIGNPS